MVAAVVQGAVAFAILSVLVAMSVLQVGASPAKVVAGGDYCTVTITNTTKGLGTATCSAAGTWFVVGMIGYGLVGVMGIAVSALFYQFLESTLGAPYAGWRNVTAWIHLLFGGVGASAATLLMAYGGYMGGAALNSGQNTFYVHTNILGPLSAPISALIGVALLGFFIGGVGYVTAWWQARRRPKAPA